MSGVGVRGERGWMLQPRARAAAFVRGHYYIIYPTRYIYVVQHSVYFNGFLFMQRHTFCTLDRRPGCTLWYCRTAFCVARCREVAYCGQWAREVIPREITRRTLRRGDVA